MTARSATVLLVATLLLLTGPAAAQPVPDPLAVIRAVLAAPGLIDYEGTKVLTAVRGPRAETVTILESYKRLGRLRLEFLSPESVAGRLMVDDGASSWQYEPSLHLVIRGPSFVRVPAWADPDRILRLYRITVLGTEEVIGRQTVALALASRAGGARRQVWVDRATGVILRTEERDASGDLLFSSFFTRISYSLNLPQGLFRFHLPAGAKVLSFHLSGDPLPTPQAVRGQAGFPLVVPAALPLGYRFKEGVVARFGALRAASVIYTDGVGVLSVFQTPTSAMAMPAVGREIPLAEGRGRFLDLGYLRVLLWESGGLTFAVIGALPLQGLQTIARALR